MNTINITFPDGSVKEFEKGITPFQVAESISSKLAEDVLVAEVNSKLIDIHNQITSNSKLRLFTFKDDIGKETYWHSTSHLMAHAIQSLFPEAKFGVGPAIEGGFYYDFDINTKLSEDDLTKIENKMMQLAQEDEPFKRKVLSKNDALDYFKEVNDKYKIELISGFDENEEIISLYSEGDFIDLCRGPHIPSVGKIKYVKLINISGSYWRGDEKRESLQRIYGISFPKKKMLDEHLELLEEAKKRDHRKLGKQLGLFSIEEESGPGLIYWHPKGASIRNTVENFWREAHISNGYDLVYSPHIGKGWLWETSGHLVNYKDSMFAPMQIDEQDYYIKPMNCPFHIMMYKANLHSYRDLPFRWAELGTVYRYEKSGVLHGLLRVRGFTQDDAHIFCTQDQIEDEIIEVIRFSSYIWNSFGFDNLKYYVSTKPEKAVGSDELWDKATETLKIALDKQDLKYEIDEGGGAFYGPKIDIKVKDALHREWQMSTIQFDFNLPERFDMKYIGEDGKDHRPLMVHRALFGSIERFMGVLIEHYGGAFPTWLAPTQAVIIPVSQNFIQYAEDLKLKLISEGIKIDLDSRNEKIGYKIREWEIQKVPYMLIVGEKEESSKTVSVRIHKEGDKGSMGVDEFLTIFNTDIQKKSFN